MKDTDVPQLFPVPFGNAAAAGDILYPVPTSSQPAGSGRASSSLYSVAPKDGSVIGAVFPGAIMGPLLDDRAQPLYDPTKFQYLASADNATRVCISHQHSKIKRYEDAKGIVKEGTHLALADIRDSIAELRYYRQHFLRLPATM